MALKGGLFLPMYQRGAMWIRLDSNGQFAIKVIVGGVNVISGGPLVETSATQLRRLNLFLRNESVQDYVVTPDQLWLDGIASTEGRVRQFVAMPIGAGYTVEAQLTGEDISGGLQFEVTPARAPPKTLDSQHLIEELFIRTLTKVVHLTHLSASDTVAQLKKSESPAGGPNIPQAKELGIAAAGYIKQCILRDPNPADTWQRDRTICFNVQILNSAVFRHVTSMDPPETPISAATYASERLPFFDIYNEISDIKGSFEEVKSIKEMDKIKYAERRGHPREEDDEDEPKYKNPIVVLNSQGVKTGFRPVFELETELASMNAVPF
ncbi:MAG: hypothetical protein Q9179_000923 [Wetmoreana sp. 5 TL-2023]